MPTSVCGANFQNETLTYVISYKWGLVQKDAGKATLTLRAIPTTYNLKLSATTLPWADKFFQVRDTLTSVINRADFRPTSYVKTTHEDGKYRRDALSYKYYQDHVYGTCNRTKINKKGKRTDTVIKSSATGSTFDMLSIFYYVRSLDFEKLTGKKVVVATILSGSSPEKIKIKNLGKETVKMPNGKTYSCYHLQFTFTTDAGKSTSDPMNTWVTTDSRHIPVKLVGSLPIGNIRAFLTSEG